MRSKPFCNVGCQRPSRAGYTEREWLLYARWDRLISKYLEVESLCAPWDKKKHICKHLIQGRNRLLTVSKPAPTGPASAYTTSAFTLPLRNKQANTAINNKQTQDPALSGNPWYQYWHYGLLRLKIPSSAWASYTSQSNTEWAQIRPRARHCMKAAQRKVLPKGSDKLQVTKQNTSVHVYTQLCSSLPWEMNTACAKAGIEIQTPKKVVP